MYKTVLLILFFNIFYDIACGKTYYPCSKRSNEGEPIQIVTFNKDKENNKFELNSTVLESILLQPEVSEKELVILSIAGSFRKGKSFFLDLLLQYLENDGNLEINKLNLTHGFHWRGGSEHDTQGMYMWSEPFCVKSPSGKELAILLMDTQGAFDSQQTFGDTSTIFALSFLTSSIQLFNLKEQIQEDDLQNLQVFTTYGSQISDNGSKSYKPFQELIFFIRDWPYPTEKQYGVTGGKQYLENIMEETNKPDKGKTLRHEIKSCFTKLSCFLMPYPGEAVAQGKFKPSDIKPDFIKEANEFSAMVFNPNNLVIKQIAGKNITGKYMYESLKTYMDAFANNEKIKPETIYDANCRASKIIAFEDSKLYYTKETNEKCSQSLSLEPSELQRHLENIRNNTIKKFNQEKPKKCEESSKNYLDDLEKWVEEELRNCTIQNLFKKISELNEQLINSTKEKMRLLGSIENLNKNLTTCQKDKNDINKNLSICNAYLGTNITSLTTCNTNLNTCNTNLNTCNTDKMEVDKNQAICNTNLKTSNKEKEETKANLNTCIDIIHHAGPCTETNDCPYLLNSGKWERHCIKYRSDPAGVCGYEER